MSNLNSPTSGTIDVLKERGHTLVLIDYLRGVQGTTIEKAQSALEYFVKNPSLSIFGHEVRKDLLEKGDEEKLLERTSELPIQLAQEVRARIKNSMESISLHKTRKLPN